MISAIIPAAGESKRMGKPKMLLKWGLGTVLSHVISVFANAGLEDILVITGSDHEKVQKLIEEESLRHPVRWVFNNSYATGGMLSSIQYGLMNLTEKESEAAMIGLGDQPQVEEGTVRRIWEEYHKTAHPLIVPSYQMRRGHPWLVGRVYWEEILQMNSPITLRDFLKHHSGEIHYVEITNPGILADLDTPTDYLKSRSKS